jgi:hypothetical protein
VFLSSRCSTRPRCAGRAQNLHTRGRVSSAISLSGPVCFGTVAPKRSNEQLTQRIAEVRWTPTTPPRPRKSGLALLAVNMAGMLNRSRDVTAVAWAVSMAVVLTTRRSAPPGDPALFLPSQLDCRVELSVGSYR